LVAEDERIGALVCEPCTVLFQNALGEGRIEALNYVLESRPDGIVLDLVFRDLPV